MAGCHYQKILDILKGYGSFPPSQTFWVFLAQVFDSDQTCRTAVRKFLSWLAYEGMEAASPNTASYVKARHRLPYEELEQTQTLLAEGIETKADKALLWYGRRVKVVDGSGISMPDTLENQEAYPQSRRQAKGCGFPSMKVVAVFSLATGVITDLVKGTLHCAERTLFRRLWDNFEEGEVILADCGFCSYADYYFLKQRKVDCVMANHQRRSKGIEVVKNLGKGDRVVNWLKMKPCPKGISKQQWENVPDKLLIREVSFHVEVRGYRTKKITVVTTLLEDQLYSKEALAELYYRRWLAELSLRDIKITMGMDILRCKTPDMVHKELVMFIIAYNLVRALMLKTAQLHGVQLKQLSFKGTLSTIRQWAPALKAVKTGRRKNNMIKAILFMISRDIVPVRPNRQEPRARKRRPKGFQLLAKPRSQFKEIQHRSKYKKA